MNAYTMTEQQNIKAEKVVKSCPKCGSHKLKVVPGFAWVEGRYGYIMPSTCSRQTYAECLNCSQHIELSKAQQAEVAKDILANREKYSFGTVAQANFVMRSWEIEHYTTEQIAACFEKCQTYNNYSECHQTRADGSQVFCPQYNACPAAKALAQWIK